MKKEASSRQLSLISVRLLAADPLEQTVLGAGHQPRTTTVASHPSPYPESLWAIVWSTDSKLRLTSALGPGLAKLNLKPSQVVGKTLQQFFSTQNGLFPAIQAHHRALRGESVTLEHQWKSNLYRTHIEPLRRVDAKIVGVVGLAIDLTELRDTREVLQSSGNSPIAVETHLAELARTNERLVRELTARKRAEGELLRQAHYDTLTDLPNRRLFLNHLNQAVELARRNRRRLAVLFLDVDHFKQINDRWGHPTGDRLLQSVASWLRSCLRASDVVARFGGDEFTILLPEVNQAEDAITVASKLLETLRSPFRIEELEVAISASIGISLYPKDGDEAELLIKRADLAMYRAKEEGRNGHRLFSQGFDLA